MKLALLIAGLSLPIVSACALRGPAGDGSFSNIAPVTASEIDKDYQIGPQDILRILVVGEPEISSTSTIVTQTGKIDVPLLGEVPVTGRSASEVATLLTSLLGQRYLVDPRVSVAVVSAAQQRVTVVGEVAKPGVFPLTGRTRLMQALALAEGTTDVARLRDVVVIRQRDGQRYAARFNLKDIRTGSLEDPLILADDTVVVGRSLSNLIYRDMVKNLPALTSAFVVIGRN